MFSWHELLNSAVVRVRNMPQGMKTLVGGIAVGIVLLIVYLASAQSMGDPAQEQHTIVSAPQSNSSSAPDLLTFDSLLQNENLFLSRSQSDRRWLVATMNMLSSAIASMDGIKQATVFIDEPKAMAGIGRNQSRATAAVTVVASESLSPDIVDAIAELVAGAHAALSVDQVRIIDSNAGQVRYARTPQELAEARHVAKLNAQAADALTYPEGATVGVHTAEEGVILASTAVEAASPASGALAAQIGWYALGLFGLLATVVLIRRAKAKPVPAESHATQDERLAAMNRDSHARRARLRLAENSVPFSFLQAAGARDILNLIHDEHPQTIALIVYNLPHHKAAAILERLPRAIQIEVARRIANMRSPNGTAVREVEAQLESRLSDRLTAMSAA